MVMEKYEELRGYANKQIKVAEHMLTMTYPLVKDPKLLLAVIERVFASLNNAMSAVLHYEWTYKRIPSFPESFEARFDLFKARCARRYNLSPECVTMIQSVRDLINEHKRSPVEFTRKNKFVICSDDYRMRTVSVDQMKEFITKAKVFIGEISGMIGEK